MGRDTPLSPSQVILGIWVIEYLVPRWHCQNRAGKGGWFRPLQVS
jgi:hypothetical protein